MSKITQTMEETTKYMWRNKKNRLFMGIMLVLMVVYVVIFAPNFNSEYDLDMNELHTEMLGNQAQAESAKDKGLIAPNVLTKTTAYIEQLYQFGTERELYTTIKQGDLHRYLEIQDMNPPQDRDTDLSTMFYSIFGSDPLPMKSWAYREELPELNFHIVHEITSLQQIHLFLIGAGPLILLSGLIFMISDVHTKDLSLSSQKSGVPLNWSGYLLVQAGAALGFVLAFYAVFFGLFYLVNGVLHGFGGLHYPISFPQETIGWFLLRTIPYIGLLFILFTRLNTLVSLWSRQAVVSMAVLLFIVFASDIYMDNFTGQIVSFNLMLLPTSYINFGTVITATHNLVPAIPGLKVYSSGLVILGITILVVEMILFLSAKRVTRQKFTAKGAK